MLSFNLEPIFKARGIQKPFSFLIKAGFTPHTAHHIISGDSRSFRLDHIEQLCLVLKCEPNDLLLFSPDKNQHYPENLPLFNLKAEEQRTDLNVLADIPFKDLKRLTAAILHSQKEEKM
jgi:DNA-binding Xre family transcriptional regulator